VGHGNKRTENRSLSFFLFPLSFPPCVDLFETSSENRQVCDQLSSPLPPPIFFLETPHGWSLFKKTLSFFLFTFLCLSLDHVNTDRTDGDFLPPLFFPFCFSIQLQRKKRAYFPPSPLLIMCGPRAAGLSFSSTVTRGRGGRRIVLVPPFPPFPPSFLFFANVGSMTRLPFFFFFFPLSCNTEPVPKQRRKGPLFFLPPPPPSLPIRRVKREKKISFSPSFFFSPPPPPTQNRTFTGFKA